MDAKLRVLISKVKKEHDDDAVDRTIYATTVYILGFFALLIMAKQYMGDPLQCWIPAEYTGAWEKYIENYCFVENTYFVNGTMPNDKTIRRNNELRYYQWIPYILSAQAVLCYVPKLLFKILYSFSDLRVTDLIQLAYRECKTQFGKDTKVADKIASKLYVRRNTNVRLSFNWYLTAIYFTMKVFSIAILLSQLIIMNYFINSGNPFWGFSLLWELYHGLDWRVNGFFPRVTFCDLQTRDIGQMRDHTVQCVLMINMFIEKIWIFVWIWFFVFLIVSVVNLFVWLYRTLAMSSKVRLVTDALRLQNVRPSPADTENFINEFLKKDGVVVLRLIDSNVGYVNMSDILYQLWNNFYSIDAKKLAAPPAQALTDS